MLTSITDHLKHDTAVMVLRKRESILAVSGMGTILFAAWSLVRTLLTLISYDGELRQQLVDVENFEVYLPIAYGVVIFLLLLDMAGRVYVGRGAMAEAGGKSKKLLAVPLSYVLLVLCLVSLISSFGTISFNRYIIPNIVAVVVEATSCVTMIVLISMTRKVRRMRKQQEQG